MTSSKKLPKSLTVHIDCRKLTPIEKNFTAVFEKKFRWPPGYISPPRDAFRDLMGDLDDQNLRPIVRRGGVVTIHFSHFLHFKKREQKFALEMLMHLAEVNAHRMSLGREPLINVAIDTLEAWYAP